MGNGQVVSVADTGVDDLSCYFIDNANGQVPRSDSVSPVAYPNQRVLVQYAVFSGGGGVFIFIYTYSYSVDCIILIITVYIIS